MVSKIVVEGFDNSGKSTLIKELAKEFKLNVHWAGGPPKDHCTAIKNATDQCAMTDVIHDRITPISRLAYEKPGYVCVEIQFLIKILEQFITDSDAFIYCVGEGGDHQLSECDTGEHLEAIKTNEDEIREKYDVIFDKVPHFKYDWRIHSVQNVIDYIRRER